MRSDELASGCNPIADELQGIVFPDDVHESLLHSRWMYTLGRMETFLNKFLGEKPVSANQ